MPAVWRASFRSEAMDLHGVRELLLAWVKKTGPDVGVASLTDAMEFTHAPSGTHVRTSSGPGGWAFRFDKPIPAQGLRWTTDVVLSADRPEVSIALGLRGLDGALSHFGSVNIRPPGLVARLYDAYPDLSPPGAPLDLIEHGTASELVDLLTDPKRAIPAVVISDGIYEHRPFIDVHEFARLSRGLCHVVHVGKYVGMQFATLLGESFGVADPKRWSVYDGGVRAYRSPIDMSGSPFDHPMWLPRDTTPYRLRDDVLRWLADNSAICQPEIEHTLEKNLRGTADVDVQTLEEIYEAELESKAAELERLAERLRTLESRNAFLEHRLEQLQSASQAPVAEESAGGLTVSFASSPNKRRPALDFVDELDDEARRLVLGELAELPAQFEAPGNPRLTVGLGGPAGGPRRRLVEFRVNTKDHWIRFFVVRAPKRRELVVLRGYAKKQNELDQGEIEAAAEQVRRLDEAGQLG